MLQRPSLVPRLTTRGAPSAVSSCDDVWILDGWHFDATGANEWNEGDNVVNPMMPDRFLGLESTCRDTDDICLVIGDGQDELEREAWSGGLIWYDNPGALAVPL